MKEIYELKNYSINFSRDGNFIFEYIYQTPTFIYDMPNDDYCEGFVFHKVVEHFNKNSELVKTEYKMSKDKKYNELGQSIRTNYNENDLKPLVESKREQILNLISKNGLYNKFSCNENGYKLSYFWGLELFFDNEGHLFKVTESDTDIEMLKYWEDDSSILLLPNYYYGFPPKRILRYYNRTTSYKAEYAY